MGKCMRCDLDRIYKIFAEKKAREEAATKLPAEAPAVVAEPIIVDEKAEEPIVEEAPVAKKAKKKKIDIEAEPEAEVEIIDDPAE